MSTKMRSPNSKQELSPKSRTRQENQERAYIAASRRKDRSLNARLESANRASILHKKRTGMAFHITKEIVQKQAMYEEIDERYQAKLSCMLRAQHMHNGEYFHPNLMTECSARADNAKPIVVSACSRRMGLMGCGSTICSSRNIDSHLSTMQPSFQQIVTSSVLGNAVVTGDLYGRSFTSKIDDIAQSSMVCANISAAASKPSLAIPLYYDDSSDVLSSSPAYETQQVSTWSSFLPLSWPWQKLQEQAINPTQLSTNSQAIHAWQQNAIQLTAPRNHIVTAANIQSCQLSDPPASVPNMPLLDSELRLAAYSESPDSTLKPTQYVYGNGHCLFGGKSQPHHRGLQTLLQRSYTIPDFCPTSSNFLLPTAVDPGTARAEKDNGTTMLYNDPDLDFNDSSHSSAGKETPSFPHTWGAEGFNLEDFIDLDDSTAYHY